MRQIHFIPDVAVVDSAVVAVVDSALVAVVDSALVAVVDSALVAVVDSALVAVVDSALVAVVLSGEVTVVLASVKDCSIILILKLIDWLELLTCWLYNYSGYAKCIFNRILQYI
jgi:hypothetical protein